MENPIWNSVYLVSRFLSNLPARFYHQGQIFSLCSRLWNLLTVPYYHLWTWGLYTGTAGLRICWTEVFTGVATD